MISALNMRKERERMTRLETLEKELNEIRQMDCLAFSIKEVAIKYYEHEIYYEHKKECIEKWGSPNPDYGDE